MTDLAWSTACPDWRDRIVNRRSLIPSPLFANEAAEALEVFKSLRIVDLPGQPTFGEVSDPWVFEFVAAIFGAYDRETGQQLIREFFLMISKKNTKSTLAAGVLVTALIRNWRFNNELLMLGPSIEIAQNCFGPAAAMVRADETLMKMLHIQEHTRTIKHLVTGAVLRIIAADTDVVTGTMAGFILVDEVWKFGKRSKSAAMFQEATGGLASRPEGFVIWLTTQSDEAPAGIFKEKLQYARDVRDGVIEDPEFLALLYEYPEAMIESGDYLKPENFYIPNPNLGRSVDLKWLTSQKRKFSGARDGSWQTFLAKHLNVEIGMRMARDRWRGADHYLKAQLDFVLTIDELITRCDVIVGGVDGGGLDDLMALALFGRDRETGDWLWWGRAWAQTDVFEARKDIVTQLEEFIKDGDLVVVPEDDATLDIREIADIFERLSKAGKLPEKGGIGLDPHAIGALVDELETRDLRQPLICAIPQGYRQTGNVWTMERKLKDRTLRPSGQRLLTWSVGNAKAESRGNATYITKETAGRAKIDPLVAAFNAADLMSRNPQAVGPSVYEQRGIRMI